MTEAVMPLVVSSVELDVVDVHEVEYCAFIFKSDGFAKTRYRDTVAGNGFTQESGSKEEAGDYFFHDGCSMDNC